MFAPAALIAQGGPDSLPAPLRVAADPAAGFQSAYFLYVPPALRADRGAPRTILVLPNNPGRVSDDPAFFEEASMSTASAFRRFAGRLGVIVLVPAFPRPAAHGRIYTHALDRDVFTTELPELRRPDLQLIAMIDDARTRLASDGITTEERVLLHGHSAAGMFANRFALLHPRRVKAATIGAPGGWPTVPLAHYESRILTWPVGVADIAELSGAPLDTAALRDPALLFFLGAEDDNDSVPYDDSYDLRERTLVMEMFGPTPAARWPAAQRLIGGVLPNARFQTYPGSGHEVTRKMWSDIESFLRLYVAPAGLP